MPQSFLLQQKRGLDFHSISKINQKSEISQLSTRTIEIKEWLDVNKGISNYVILDDDKSIGTLAEDIKSHWVVISPFIGFDEVALEKALKILQ